MIAKSAAKKAAKKVSVGAPSQAPKKRGRPPKKQAVEVSAEVVASPDTPVPAAAAPTASTCDGPRTIEGILYFGEKDLLRYELQQTKFINSIQAYRIRKEEKGQFERDAAQRLKMFEVEIADLKALSSQEEAALVAMQDELQKAYGLNLKEISYDDKTGRIMLHGESVAR